MHLDLLTKRVASFAAYAFSVRSKHNTSEKEFFFYQSALLPVWRLIKTFFARWQ